MKTTDSERKCKNMADVRVSKSNGNGTFPVLREKTGRFTKGISGNPGGRPRSSIAAMREAVLEHSAIGAGQRNNLLKLVKRLYKEDPRTYLAYGFGKPIETHHIVEGEHIVDPELIAAAREVAKSFREQG